MAGRRLEERWTAGKRERETQEWGEEVGKEGVQSRKEAQGREKVQRRGDIQGREEAQGREEDQGREEVHGRKEAQGRGGGWKNGRGSTGRSCQGGWARVLGRVGPASGVECSG